MAWRLVSELLGRDVYSQRMRALQDIDHCHSKLASILSQSVFDPDFDDERHALEKALDAFRDRLKHGVTYNDWWALAEKKIEAKRRASHETYTSTTHP